MSTPANPVTSDALEARFYRPLTAREESIAQQWLDDAWLMLVDRRPNLPADMTAATVRSETVERVVAGMVMRVFKNPEALVMERLDDYQNQRDAAVASGELYVSPADLSDVTPGRAARRSIRMVAYGEYTP